MNNIINICFTEGAGGRFRIASKMNELDSKPKVIVLFDDLSHGTIKDGIDIEERINWWKVASGDEYFIEYGADELKENYNAFHNEISQIDRSDILYLW